VRVPQIVKSDASDARATNSSAKLQENESGIPRLSVRSIKNEGDLVLPEPKRESTRRLL
jgi:hypothetical protein